MSRELFSDFSSINFSCKKGNLQTVSEDEKPLYMKEREGGGEWQKPL